MNGSKKPLPKVPTVTDIHMVVCEALDIELPDDMSAEFTMEDDIPTISGEICQRRYGTEYKIQFKKGKWVKA